MAVITPARVGKLRLNAGRLAYVAPTIPHSPNPPHQSYAGPLAVSWLCTPALFEVYVGTTPTPPLVGTTRSLGWVLPPLTVGVTYYWRVVATNDLGPPAAGPLWSFTAAVPAAPILPFPPHHSTNQAPALTLSWTQPLTVPGDIVFDVYFGPTPSAPLVSRRQTAATYTPALLEDGVDYYWRVVAINNVGATSGPTWTFETRNPTQGLITVGGVDVRGRTRMAGLRIRDLLNLPNTAALTLEGTAPTLAQEIRIGLATLAGDDVVFGGYIDTVEAVYEGRPENRAWRVTAQDYVVGINRRKVRRRYGQQSATAIALDLITLDAPAGYTGAAVQAGLPIVPGGIDFTEEDLSVCFGRLAQRIGGYWYIDYAKSVHLFLTEATEAPAAITADGRVLLDSPPITWEADLTQIRTRVFVEGGGSAARALVAVGATALPVTDASWYAPTGGLVVSGPQRIRYTGKGTVGGPAAPTATGQAVVGALGGGPYSYVVTQIIAGAESPLSAPSLPVTLSPVASPPTAIQVSAYFSGVVAPTAAPTVTPFLSGVAAPTTGPTVAWATTMVPEPTGTVGVDSVKTTVDPPTSQVSPAPALPMTGYIDVSGRQPTLQMVDIGSGGIPTSGSIAWVFTATNSRGETTRSTPIAVGVSGPVYTFNASIGVPNLQDATVTSTKIYRSRDFGPYLHVGTIAGSAGGTFLDNKPDAALGAAAPSTNTTGTPGGGSMAPGYYLYRVTFGTSQGATQAGPSAGNTVSGSYTGMQLHNIPASSDGRVTKRTLWRTKANGGTYYLLGTLNDNVTTSVMDTAADAQLGAVLSDTNTTGTGALVGGQAYAWAVTFVSSGGETLLGPRRDHTMPAGYDTAQLSGIPTSADGRVTSRRLYRASGGGAFRLEATLSGNVTTTYTSTKADAQLGAAPPSANTTGNGGLVVGRWYAWAVTFVTSQGETPVGPWSGSWQVPAGSDQMQLSAIPVGPATVIARRVYRITYESVAWSQWELVTTLNDNVTTAYLDAKTDAQLGKDAPTANTTGGGGLVPGVAYAWLVTFGTASGETTPGPWTGSVTMPANCDMAALTLIPLSNDGRTTRRKLYRLGPGGVWQLEATIADNVTTTYTSSKADGALGATGLPPANTTGTGGLTPLGWYYWTVKFVSASGGESGEAPDAYFQMPAGTDTAQLWVIPTSADGRVTKRRLYRTTANGYTYRLEQELADNVTTTATSTKADSALGVDMVRGNTTSAGGQIAVAGIAIGGGTTTQRKLYRTESGGSAYKLVATIENNTATTYQDNKSDASLGALAPVDEVTELIGIPPSGEGSIQYEIRMGDDVNLLVQCDDLPAQAALAALEGGGSTGIVEHFLQDRRLALSTASATGFADLALFARPIITVRYATRDPRTRAGKTVTITLPELSLTGDFTIQSVDIDEINRAPGLMPRFTVTASSIRFSLEDVLRRLQLTP